MANKVIDPVPIIKNLADRCMKAKGLECSVLGSVIDMLKAAPAVHNAPYWATEEAYKNGYEAGKQEAVEVVHGRWIFKHNPITDPKGYFIRIVCSECNLHTGQKSNYCPQCGAKMDGGKDNG